MDAATIRILIEANSSGVSTALASALASVKAFEKGTDSSFAKIKKSFDSLSTGQKAFAGATIAIGLLATALGPSIKAAIAFESAFAGVKKTVDGTPQQLERIRSGLIGMSQAMPVAANDLANIAASAGQLGISTPNILEFTETIAILGATTDLVDFENAAQSMARFINVSDAGQGDIGKLADVIVRLGNNTATTESQILTFASRLASGLTVAGVSAPEILGLGAAFSSMGVEAEAGASSLSTIFAIISDAAVDGGQDLTILANTTGMTTQAFRDLVRENPTEAFLQFAEGLGGIIREGESITPVLEGLGLEGIRTSRVLKLAAVNSDILRHALGLANDEWENGGAAQREFNVRLETTAAKLTILRNTLSAFAISIGSATLGVVASGLDGVTKGVTELAAILEPLASELVGLFANVGTSVGFLASSLGAPVFKTAAATFIGITSVLSALLGVLNSLGPAGSTVALVVGYLLADLYLVGPVSVSAASGLTAMGAAGGFAATAMSALQAAWSAGPLIILTVALASLGAALYDAGKKAKEAGDDYREGIASAIEETDFSKLKGEVESIRSTMERLREIDTVGDFSSWDSWGTAIKSVGQILTPFTENTVVNARAEIEELQAVLEETQADQLVSGLERLAADMGITFDQAFALADGLGILDQVFADGALSAEEYAWSSERASIQIRELEVSGLAASGGIDQLTDAAINGAVPLDELAESLGVSVETLIALDAISEAVDLDQLASDEIVDRLNQIDTVTGEIEGKFGPLAAAVGLTTDEFIQNSEAVRGAAGAFNELKSAIDNAVSGINAYDDAQAQLVVAQANLDELSAAFDGTDESITNNILALQQYVAALAATSGDPYEAIAFQENFARSLVDNAVAAGRNRDEVIALITQLGLFPPEVLSSLTLDTEEARTNLDEVDERTSEYSGSVFEATATVDIVPAEERLDQLIADGRIPEWERDHVGSFSADTGTAQTSVDSLVGSDSYIEWQGDHTGTFSAETAQSHSDLLGLQAAAKDRWDGQQFDATMGADTADGIGAIDTIESEATEFATREYIPTVGADITDALSKFGSAEDEGNAFASADYTALLKANAEGAKLALALISELIKRWHSADYTAALRADPAHAVSASEYARASAIRFASGSYVAVLRADVGQAVSAINYAISVLSQFRSKTIYVRSILSSISNADGNIIPRFAEGGVTARPGTANIYAPAAPYRIFAEPETGGEAYIPLSPGKRDRSLAIWRQVGAMFGQFADGAMVRRYADGGFSGVPRAGNSGGPALLVNAPFQIYAAQGQDPKEIAKMVDDRLRKTMKEAARDLRNTRR